jgi:starch-binding outer membrane protein, SusD/RagB family
MLLRKIYNRITAAAILLLLVSGCKKLDLAPTNRFTELTFWQVDQNVNNALNNVYGGMYSARAVFYNDALSDNAFAKLAGLNGADAITSGNFTPTLPRFQNDWAGYYASIKSCNIFLENVGNNTTLSDSIKNRMRAEVRFVRAWLHFNLMKWWGDVPLLSKDISPEEAKTISRTPRTDVLKFVLDELTAAAAVLPTKDQYPAADNGRITKGAALALKARVLLYEGNRMQEVVEICEQFFNTPAVTGNYGLVSNYTDVFSDKNINKVNNESMLSLQYVPNERMWEDHIDLVPISAGARTGGMSPTQELVNAYLMLNGKTITEAGSGYDENDPYVNRDPRLTATVVYNGYVWPNIGGGTQVIYIKPGSTTGGASSANEYSAAGQGSATGYYWRKYYDLNSLPVLKSGLNVHLIRYAEVLLMYAEAKHSLGQMTAAVWDRTIKALRQRAGFTNSAALDYPSGATTAAMTQIIRNERRCELAMEGLRADDIRRWKISETVLNGWAHGAKYGDPSIDNGYIRAQLRVFDKNKHYLWPIPPSERALNNNLTQNPNY